MQSQISAIRPWVASLCLVLAAPVNAQAPARCWSDIPNESLPVCLRGQQRQSWCWAASAQMIMTYLDAGNADEYQQFKLANTGYLTECPSENCAPGLPSKCDENGLFPEFQKLDHDFRALFVPRALSWVELKEEIAAKRPVSFSWCWRAPGITVPCRQDDPLKDSGHVMVAAGVGSIEQMVDGKPHSVRAVRVLDPRCCCQGDIGYLTYEEYRQGPGHLHWRDYYCIRVGDTACPVLPDQEPAFEPDAPAFASARKAAESVREAWLANLGSVEQRELLVLPMIASFGAPVASKDVPQLAAVETVLDREIRVRTVPPDSLAAVKDDFSKPELLESLFDSSEISIFPVRVKASSTTAPWLALIEVQRGAGGLWRVTWVGAPIHAKRLYGLLASLPPAEANSEYIEVRVPGLKMSVLVDADPNRRISTRSACGSECERGDDAPPGPRSFAAGMKVLRAAAASYIGGPS